MGHVGIRVPWSLYESILWEVHKIIFIVDYIGEKRLPWCEAFEYRVAIGLASIPHSLHHRKTGKLLIPMPLLLNQYIICEYHNQSPCSMVAISFDASNVFMHLFDVKKLGSGWWGWLFWMMLRPSWLCSKFKWYDLMWGGGFVTYLWQYHDYGTVFVSTCRWGGY